MKLSGVTRKRLGVGLALAALLATPVARSQAPAPAAHEKSVKPGINDQWKSPSVEPLIGTLESESREIYTQRAKLADLVGLRPGMAVADVGAGSGFMAEEFARRVGAQGKVYAVDINPKLLEHIAERARKDGIANIQTVLGKDDSVELPANSVDVIFICDTYHHFEYPLTILKSISRALKPGGHIVLVEFVREPGKSPGWVLDHVRAGQHVFTQEITSAGFESPEAVPAPFLTQNYVLRFRKSAAKPAAEVLPLLVPAQGARPGLVAALP